jgi:hypothetical protein
MTLTYEDAMSLLIRWLRSPDHGNYGSFGYDVYLPAIVRTYLHKEKRIQSQYDQEPLVTEMMPMLYAAAWDLCRRGVIRPGINRFGAQATDDGNAGNGYSITPFGKQWLSEKDQDTFVPMEPERFAQMLTPYKDRFGASFYERAQEAIRCYGAHAYLACCAMCGAATEAIILAVAIRKANETEVIKEYLTANGRRKIENIILGQARQQLRDEYRGYTTLLKYWRDSAAHGAPSNINDNEAYTALALLLRFSMFVNDNWSELIGT